MSSSSTSIGRFGGHTHVKTGPTDALSQQARRLGDATLISILLMLVLVFVGLCRARLADLPAPQSDSAYTEAAASGVVIRTDSGGPADKSPLTRNEMEPWLTSMGQ